MDTPVPEMLVFKEGGYFYDIVAAFTTAVIGLESVFDPKNPMSFRPEQAGRMEGKVQPYLLLTPFSVHKQALAGNISSAGTIAALCNMLVGTAYNAVEGDNDHSPMFEYFRHVRNASSHGNRFNFRPWEPNRPASWRTKTMDESLKGSANPLHGQTCFLDYLAAPDAILLLWDIEQYLAVKGTIPQLAHNDVTR